MERHWQSPTPLLEIITAVWGPITGSTRPGVIQGTSHNLGVLEFAHVLNPIYLSRIELQPRVHSQSEAKRLTGFSRSNHFAQLAQLHLGPTLKWGISR